MGNRFSQCSVIINRSKILGSHWILRRKILRVPVQSLGAIPQYKQKVQYSVCREFGGSKCNFAPWLRPRNGLKLLPPYSTGCKKESLLIKFGDNGFSCVSAYPVTNRQKQTDIAVYTHTCMRRRGKNKKLFLSLPPLDRSYTSLPSAHMLTGELISTVALNLTIATIDLEAALEVLAAVYDSCSRIWINLGSNLDQTHSRLKFG